MPHRQAVMTAATIVTQRLMEPNTSAVNSHNPAESMDVVRGIVDALSRRWFRMVGIREASMAVLAAAMRKSALSEMISSISARGSIAARAPIDSKNGHSE